MQALARLFEKRLNADPEEPDPGQDWLDIFIYLIPKTKNPTTISTWRPIAIVNSLQKAT